MSASGNVETDQSTVFVEQFEKGFLAIVQTVKDWDSRCVENPSKRNDLTTSVTADLQSLIDDLKKKFNGTSIDFQKLIAALDRLSPKEYSEGDTKALIFVLEIFLKMMENAKP